MSLKLPLAALLALTFAGEACASQQSAVGEVKNCSVSGDEKVLARVGGSEAICREIGKALGHSEYVRLVTVQVKRTHMSAQVELADGRSLPEIGFAVSDAALSERSISKFAAHVAASVRETGR